MSAGQPFVMFGNITVSLEPDGALVCRVDDRAIQVPPDRVKQFAGVVGLVAGQDPSPLPTTVLTARNNVFIDPPGQGSEEPGADPSEKP